MARILVIEDKLDSLHTLCYLFRDMGHGVDYAINGYVALDAARRYRPDHVVLDLGLPGMTGFEVCAQIKKDPELAHINVIAHTAYDREDFRARAAQVGFDEYLVKPVTIAKWRELFAMSHIAPKAPESRPGM
jgi:CheY-like chemotaxis protein